MEINGYNCADKHLGDGRVVVLARPATKVAYLGISPLYRVRFAGVLRAFCNVDCMYILAGYGAMYSMCPMSEVFSGA